MRTETSSRSNPRLEVAARRDSEIQEKNALLRDIRQDAEALLEQHGTPRKAGRIKGPIRMVASKVHAVAPTLGVEMKVHLPADESIGEKEPITVLIRGDSDSPADSSRIDIKVIESGPIRPSFDLPHTGGYLPGQKDLSLDVAGRGSVRYDGLVGNHDDLTQYISADQARNYQQAINRVKAKLAPPTHTP